MHRKTNMKIAYRRPNDNCHSKSLFVAISKFETHSFPVPVRHFRFGETKASKTFLRVSSLGRQGIPHRKRQGRMNPSEVVVPTSLQVPRGTARRVPKSYD